MAVKQLRMDERSMRVHPLPVLRRIRSPGIPLTAAVFTFVVGTIGFAGWVFGIEGLKSLVGTITMKANMAIGLIAHGLALAMVVRGSPRARFGGTALAALGSTIGGLTLAEHLFGWNLGIDELLFSEPPGAAGTASPGRMGPNGAMSLLLAGLAIISLRRDGRRAAVCTQALACTMTVLATIPVAGYAYGAQQLYSIAQYTGIAFATALSFLALGIGILATRADSGLMAVLAASGPGGVMARRLLLPAIVLPLVLGWVRVLGQRANLYDTGLGTALFVICVASVFVVLIWRTAVQLNAVDAERQRAEQERALLLEREHQARVEVEHANRLKDHFLATLSHELRTPLNAMLGYARMLRIGAIPLEKQPRAIQIIERNAAAQNQLVDDLLDMSRMTTGRIRLEKQSVPAIAPLQEAIESVRPTVDAKRIALHVETEPFAGSVYGDDGRLRQIFWNLLSNAVKFTPEGGQIHVGLEADRDSIRVTVRDSGIGIEPAFFPHIFEPFRQADMGSGRRYGGLGLGLAICRQLAELHGGSITADSGGLGRGATFTVQLPRYAAESGGAPEAREVGIGGVAATASSETRPLTGVEVLVVDDEPDSLDLARHLLERAGALVRTASHASDALRQFDERVPDLLVADIGLPGADGCELLQEIRARSRVVGRHVPAVAMTAYVRSDDRLRTREAGFNDHVAKPIDPEMFVKAVSAVAGPIRNPRTPDASLT